MSAGDISPESTVKIAFCYEEDEHAIGYSTMGVVDAQMGIVPAVGDVVRYFPNEEFRTGGMIVKRREFFYRENGLIDHIELFMIPNSPD